MNTKLSIFTILACVALLVPGCSKDDENIPGGIVPPKFITDAFQMKYPGARDIEWKVVYDYYLADFKLDSAEVDAWFTPTDGEWIMAESSLHVTELPDEITAAIQSGNYAGWTIDDAYTIDRKGFGLVYKVEVEKGNMDTYLYMSQYGGLIKAMDNAVDNTDKPIAIPEKVANFMELTFAGAELLDIENTTFGVQLAILDGTILKFAELTQIYTWKSTTWEVSEKEVPNLIMDAFRASEYGNDPVKSIYVFIDANGSFHKFNVTHNGQAVTVEFDVFGNIVTGK